MKKLISSLKRLCVDRLIGQRIRHRKSRQRHSVEPLEVRTLLAARLVGSTLYLSGDQDFSVRTVNQRVEYAAGAGAFTSDLDDSIPGEQSLLLSSQTECVVDFTGYGPSSRRLKVEDFQVGNTDVVFRARGWAGVEVVGALVTHGGNVLIESATIDLLNSALISTGNVTAGDLQLIAADDGLAAWTSIHIEGNITASRIDISASSRAGGTGATLASAVSGAFVTVGGNASLMATEELRLTADSAVNVSSQSRLVDFGPLTVDSYVAAAGTISLAVVDVSGQAELRSAGNLDLHATNSVTVSAIATADRQEQDPRNGALAAAAALQYTSVNVTENARIASGGDLTIQAHSNSSIQSESTASSKGGMLQFGLRDLMNFLSAPVCDDADGDGDDDDDGDSDDIPEWEHFGLNPATLLDLASLLSVNGVFSGVWNQVPDEISFAPAAALLLDLNRTSAEISTTADIVSAGTTQISSHRSADRVALADTSAVTESASGKAGAVAISISAGLGSSTLNSRSSSSSLHVNSSSISATNVTAISGNGDGNALDLGALALNLSLPNSSQAIIEADADVTVRDSLLVTAEQKSQDRVTATGRSDGNFELFGVGISLGANMHGLTTAVAAVSADAAVECVPGVTTVDVNAVQNLETTTTVVAGRTSDWTALQLTPAAAVSLQAAQTLAGVGDWDGVSNLSLSPAHLNFGDVSRLSVSASSQSKQEISSKGVAGDDAILSPPFNGGISMGAVFSLSTDRTKAVLDASAAAKTVKVVANAGQSHQVDAVAGLGGYDSDVDSVNLSDLVAGYVTNTILHSSPYLLLLSAVGDLIPQSSVALAGNFVFHDTTVEIADQSVIAATGTLAVTAENQVTSATAADSITTSSGAAFAVNGSVGNTRAIVHEHAVLRGAGIEISAVGRNDFTATATGLGKVAGSAFRSGKPSVGNSSINLLFHDVHTAINDGAQLTALDEGTLEIRSSQLTSASANATAATLSSGAGYSASWAISFLGLQTNTEILPDAEITGASEIVISSNSEVTPHNDQGMSTALAGSANYNPLNVRKEIAKAAADYTKTVLKSRFPSVMGSGLAFVASNIVKLLIYTPGVGSVGAMAVVGGIINTRTIVNPGANITQLNSNVNAAITINSLNSVNVKTTAGAAIATSDSRTFGYVAALDLFQNASEVFLGGTLSASGSIDVKAELTETSAQSGVLASISGIPDFSRTSRQTLKALALSNKDGEHPPRKPQTPDLTSRAISGAIVFSYRDSRASVTVAPQTNIQSLANVGIRSNAKVQETQNSGNLNAAMNSLSSVGISAAGSCHYVNSLVDVQAGAVIKVTGVVTDDSAAVSIHSNLTHQTDCRVLGIAASEADVAGEALGSIIMAAGELKSRVTLDSSNILARTVPHSSGRSRNVEILAASSVENTAVAGSVAAIPNLDSSWQLAMGAGLAAGILDRQTEVVTTGQTRILADDHIRIAAKSCDDIFLLSGAAGASKGLALAGAVSGLITQLGTRVLVDAEQLDAGEQLTLTATAKGECFVVSGESAVTQNALAVSGGSALGMCRITVEAELCHAVINAARIQISSQNDMGYYSIAVSGGFGDKGIAAGLAAAINVVHQSVNARLESATVRAAESVSISAVAQPLVFAGSGSIAAGGIVAGAGTLAANGIASEVHAEIRGSSLDGQTIAPEGKVANSILEVRANDGSRAVLLAGGIGAARSAGGSLCMGFNGIGESLKAVEDFIDPVSQQLADLVPFNKSVVSLMQQPTLHGTLAGIHNSIVHFNKVHVASVSGNSFNEQELPQASVFGVLQGLADADILCITVGAGGGSIGSAAVIAVNAVTQEVRTVISGSDIHANQITAESENATTIVSPALALAYGSSAAVGALVSANYVSGIVETRIDQAKLHKKAGRGQNSGNHQLASRDASEIYSVTGTFGGGGLAIAATLALNWLNTSTTTSVHSSDVQADSVEIIADHQPRIISLAGGLAAGSGFAVGGIMSLNLVGPSFSGIVSSAVGLLGAGSDTDHLLNPALTGQQLSGDRAGTLVDVLDTRIESPKTELRTRLGLAKPRISLPSSMISVADDALNFLLNADIASLSAFGAASSITGNLLWSANVVAEQIEVLVDRSEILGESLVFNAADNGVLFSACAGLAVGSTAGAGGALQTNVNLNTTQILISDSDLRANEILSVNATSAPVIRTITAQVSGSNGVSASTAASLNWIATDAVIDIRCSELMSEGAITLTAHGQPLLLALSGSLGIGLSAGAATGGLSLNLVGNEAAELVGTISQVVVAAVAEIVLELKSLVSAAEIRTSIEESSIHCETLKVTSELDGKGNPASSTLSADPAGFAESIDDTGIVAVTGTAGGGTWAGFNGVVSINSVSVDIQISILHSELTAQTAEILTEDRSNLVALTGVASGGAVAGSGLLSINQTGNTTHTYVFNSTLQLSDGAAIRSVAAPVVLAVNLLAAGGVLAGAFSGTLNWIFGSTETQLDQVTISVAPSADVKSPLGVDVDTVDSSNLLSISLAGAIGLGAAAGSVGVNAVGHGPTQVLKLIAGALSVVPGLDGRLEAVTAVLPEATVRTVINCTTIVTPGLQIHTAFDNTRGRGLPHLLATHLMADHSSLKDSQIVSLATGMAGGLSSYAALGTLNTIHMQIASRIEGDSVLVVSAGFSGEANSFSTSITAEDKASIASAAIAVAIGGGSSSGLLSANTIGNSVSAVLEESKVQSSERVEVRAESAPQIFSATGNLARAIGSALAGTAALNWICNQTLAKVHSTTIGPFTNNDPIQVAQQVLVESRDVSLLDAAGGGMTTAGVAGIGANVGLNIVGSGGSAYYMKAVEAVGDAVRNFFVDPAFADTRRSSQAPAAMVHAEITGQSRLSAAHVSVKSQFGPEEAENPQITSDVFINTLGVGGSASIVAPLLVVGQDIRSWCSDSEITADDLKILAIDNTNARSRMHVGAGAGIFGAGLSLSAADVANRVQAEANHVRKSAMSAPLLRLSIVADVRQIIDTSADTVTASLGGSAAATVAANFIHNDVSARLIGGFTADESAVVQAVDASKIVATALAAQAGTVATGGSAAFNSVRNRMHTLLGYGVYDLGRTGIQVHAKSGPTLTAIAQGNSGGTAAAGAGAAAFNWLCEQVDATISKADVNAAGTVDLSAIRNPRLQVHAEGGAVAVGASGGAAVSLNAVTGNLATELAGLYQIPVGWFSTFATESARYSNSTDLASYGEERVRAFIEQGSRIVASRLIRINSIAGVEDRTAQQPNLAAKAAAATTAAAGTLAGALAANRITTIVHAGADTAHMQAGNADGDLRGLQHPAEMQVRAVDQFNTTAAVGTLAVGGAVSAATFYIDNHAQNNVLATLNATTFETDDLAVDSLSRGKISVSDAATSTEALGFAVTPAWIRNRVFNTTRSSIEANSNSDRHQSRGNINVRANDSTYVAGVAGGFALAAGVTNISVSNSAIVRPDVTAFVKGGLKAKDSINITATDNGSAFAGVAATGVGSLADITLNSSAKYGTISQGQHSQVLAHAAEHSSLEAGGSIRFQAVSGADPGYIANPLISETRSSIGETQGKATARLVGNGVLLAGSMHARFSAESAVNAFAEIPETAQLTSGLSDQDTDDVIVISRTENTANVGGAIDSTSVASATTVWADSNTSGTSRATMNGRMAGRDLFVIGQARDSSSAGIDLHRAGGIALFTSWTSATSQSAVDASLSASEVAGLPRIQATGIIRVAADGVNDVRSLSNSSDFFTAATSGNATSVGMLELKVQASVGTGAHLSPEQLIIESLADAATEVTCNNTTSLGGAAAESITNLNSQASIEDGPNQIDAQAIRVAARAIDNTDAKSKAAISGAGATSSDSLTSSKIHASASVGRQSNITSDSFVMTSTAVSDANSTSDASGLGSANASANKTFSVAALSAVDQGARIQPRGTHSSIVVISDATIRSIDSGEDARTFSPISSANSTTKIDRLAAITTVFDNVELSALCIDLGATVHAQLYEYSGFDIPAAVSGTGNPSASVTAEGVVSMVDLKAGSTRLKSIDAPWNGGPREIVLYNVRIAAETILDIAAISYCPFGIPWSSRTLIDVDSRTHVNIQSGLQITGGNILAGSESALTLNPINRGILLSSNGNVILDACNVTQIAPSALIKANHQVHITAHGTAFLPAGFSLRPLNVVELLGTIIAAVNSPRFSGVAIEIDTSALVGTGKLIATNGVIRYRGVLIERGNNARINRMNGSDALRIQWITVKTAAFAVIETWYPTSGGGSGGDDNGSGSVGGGALPPR